MKSKIAVGLVAIVLLFVFIFCREVIDAGHVGIKVNLYGDRKGVDNVALVSGAVFYNPITTTIYEYPAFVQNKSYEDDQAFVVHSKDGTPFRVSPKIAYRILPEKVPSVFSKFRKPIEQLEDGYLATVLYNSFRDASNSYTADSLISNRKSFEKEVIINYTKQISTNGFVLEDLTSNLEYPKSLLNAVEAKNNSVQQALKAENDVKKAEANAKIKIAEAEGQAKSMLAIARAEAEANKLKQSTLTPMLLKQQWIEAWKAGGSQVPHYISGKGGENFIVSEK